MAEINVKRLFRSVGINLNDEQMEVIQSLLGSGGGNDSETNITEITEDNLEEAIKQTSRVIINIGKSIKYNELLKGHTVYIPKAIINGNVIPLHAKFLADFQEKGIPVYGVRKYYAEKNKHGDYFNIGCLADAPYEKSFNTKDVNPELPEVQSEVYVHYNTEIAPLSITNSHLENVRMIDSESDESIPINLDNINDDFRIKLSADDYIKNKKVKKGSDYEYWLNNYFRIVPDKISEDEPTPADIVGILVGFEFETPTQLLKDNAVFLYSKYDVSKLPIQSITYSLAPEDSQPLTIRFVNTFFIKRSIKAYDYEYESAYVPNNVQLKEYQIGDFINKLLTQISGGYNFEMDDAENVLDFSLYYRDENSGCYCYGYYTLYDRKSNKYVYLIFLHLENDTYMDGEHKVIPIIGLGENNNQKME